ncbi:NfeD family protein [Pseudalkalibacillus hwajinpoensis]|uniref:NfeD family protein n=1 Tax=Guptibacillus hwajinpoensis TaxID=208199 RepID=UPI001CD3F8E2|nr:nodulation protein NfeD [Pseudalkalibacillus hwajinpoensis]MCA0992889.1 nodulation protein NfeD [Pseudalkalibacillus hwajinpoensis]
MRVFVSVCFMMMVILPFAGNFVLSKGEGDLVTFIPVEQEVERGLEAFLKRSIQDAEDQGADHIVLEINTPGGAVNAADNIAKIIKASDVPITAYVSNRALSAGAYIALNADQIIMEPGALMGSAAIIDQSGNAAGKKAESFWHAAMKSAAELNERDPKYALAMADPDVDLPDYNAPKGELLTLSDQEAVEVGYAEGTAEDRTELLNILNLEEAKISDAEVSIAERIARFVTNPIIIPILLSIGSLGLVLELYSPGFGVPGFMGAGALLLFFFGHMIAGFAGWESLLLLIVGVVLILVEVFIPGFGIFGVLGAVGIVASIILASGQSMQYVLLAVLIAIAVTIGGSYLFIRIFGYRGFFKKIILSDSTKTELGYVSNATRNELIGMEGKAVTPLRPSGIADFGDERMDVVTEGGFLPAGTVVKIVKTNGSRVVVRASK